MLPSRWSSVQQRSRTTSSERLHSPTPPVIPILSTSSRPSRSALRNDRNFGSSQTLFSGNKGLTSGNSDKSIAQVDNKAIGISETLVSTNPQNDQQKIPQDMFSSSWSVNSQPVLASSTSGVYTNNVSSIARTESEVIEGKSLNTEVVQLSRRNLPVKVRSQTADVSWIRSGISSSIQSSVSANKPPILSGLSSKSPLILRRQDRSSSRPVSMHEEDLQKSELCYSMKAFQNVNELSEKISQLQSTNSPASRFKASSQKFPGAGRWFPDAGDNPLPWTSHPLILNRAASLEKLYAPMLKKSVSLIYFSKTDTARGDGPPVIPSSQASTDSLSASYNNVRSTDVCQSASTLLTDSSQFHQKNFLSSSEPVKYSAQFSAEKIVSPSSQHKVPVAVSSHYSSVSTTAGTPFGDRISSMYRNASRSKLKSSYFINSTSSGASEIKQTEPKQTQGFMNSPLAQRRTNTSFSAPAILSVSSHSVAAPTTTTSCLTTPISSCLAAATFLPQPRPRSATFALWDGKARLNAPPEQQGLILSRGNINATPRYHPVDTKFLTKSASKMTVEPVGSPGYLIHSRRIQTISSSAINSQEGKLIHPDSSSVAGSPNTCSQPISQTQTVSFPTSRPVTTIPLASSSFASRAVSSSTTSATPVAVASIIQTSPASKRWSKVNPAFSPETQHRNVPVGGSKVSSSEDVADRKTSNDSIPFYFSGPANDNEKKLLTRGASTDEQLDESIDAMVSNALALKASQLPSIKSNESPLLKSKLCHMTESLLSSQMSKQNSILELNTKTTTICPPAKGISVKARSLLFTADGNQKLSPKLSVVSSNQVSSEVPVSSEFTKIENVPKNIAPVPVAAACFLGGVAVLPPLTKESITGNVSSIKHLCSESNKLTSISQKYVTPGKIFTEASKAPHSSEATTLSKSSVKSTMFGDNNFHPTVSSNNIHSFSSENTSISPVASSTPSGSSVPQPLRTALRISSVSPPVVVAPSCQAVSPRAISIYSHGRSESTNFVYPDSVPIKSSQVTHHTATVSTVNVLSTRIASNVNNPIGLDEISKASSNICSQKGIVTRRAGVWGGVPHVRPSAVCKSWSESTTTETGTGSDKTNAVTVNKRNSLDFTFKDGNEKLDNKADIRTEVKLQSDNKTPNITATYETVEHITHTVDAMSSKPEWTSVVKSDLELAWIADPPEVKLLEKKSNKESVQAQPKSVVLEKPSSKLVQPNTSESKLKVSTGLQSSDGHESLTMKKGILQNNHKLVATNDANILNTNEAVGSVHECRLDQSESKKSLRVTIGLSVNNDTQLVGQPENSVIDSIVQATPISEHSVLSPSSTITSSPRLSEDTNLTLFFTSRARINPMEKLSGESVQGEQSQATSALSEVALEAKRQRLMREDSFNRPDSPMFHQLMDLPKESVIRRHRQRLDRKYQKQKDPMLDADSLSDSSSSSSSSSSESDPQRVPHMSPLMMRRAGAVAGETTVITRSPTCRSPASSRLQHGNSSLTGSPRTVGGQHIQKSGKFSPVQSFFPRLQGQENKQPASSSPSQMNPRRGSNPLTTDPSALHRDSDPLPRPHGTSGLSRSPRQQQKAQQFNFGSQQIGNVQGQQGESVHKSDLSSSLSDEEAAVRQKVTRTLVL